MCRAALVYIYNIWCCCTHENCFTKHDIVPPHPSHVPKRHLYDDRAHTHRAPFTTLTPKYRAFFNDNASSSLICNIYLSMSPCRANAWISLNVITLQYFNVIDQYKDVKPEDLLLQCGSWDWLILQFFNSPDPSYPLNQEPSFYPL